MLTPHEAYRRVIKNDPTFIVKNGVDYDKQYYVFTGPLDMYAVDKRLGTVVSFVPTTNMEKYFDAVKRRPLDVSSLQHNDNDELYLEARGSSQIPTKSSSPDQSPTNRPVSREKTKRAVKGSIKVGERRHRSTTSQQGIKQGEKHEGLRTHTLPKMKSLTATAKPMRKLTSKELSKIRSEARIKQLKKDGDYTGEYKKKRRK